MHALVNSASEASPIRSRGFTVGVKLIDQQFHGVFGHVSDEGVNNTLEHGKRDVPVTTAVVRANHNRNYTPIVRQSQAGEQRMRTLRRDDPDDERQILSFHQHDAPLLIENSTGQVVWT